MSISTINWQQPYVNTFKHFAIASDANALKQGDVTSVMDSQIKASVYKLVGSSPSNTFIQMPKLAGQSLGLTGRYAYFLIKPLPNKCFTLHLNVSTVESQTIRVSIGNAFKEFKQTPVCIQFPYVAHAAKGSLYEMTASQVKGRELLSGPAPPLTKWTLICLDMLVLMRVYANRTYTGIRAYK
jgi:hypothetical protein